MKTEYAGNIVSVRAVEDCIRRSNKYTKGAFRKAAVHPVQGEDFPSHVLTEYYEVYPDTEISWDMPAGKAIDWLWGEVTHIDVLFWYSYPQNKGRVTVRGGHDAVIELKKGIKGLSLALQNVDENGHK